MRPFFLFVLALATLALHPALAQVPSSAAPAGTQNPALAQPRLVAPPPPAQLVSPPPVQPGPGPQPDAPSAASLIVPGGAGGLCECLINHDPGQSVFDKTKMHQRCLGNVEACQALCNTPRYFSFVPHAVYTCPGQPGPESRPVAANGRGGVRVASSR
jgi:hypothetical protein